MEPIPHNTKNAATSAANADDGQSQFEAQDTIHHSTDSQRQQRAAANPAYQTAVMLAREYRLRVYPVHGWHDGRCTCEKGAQCDDGGKHPILNGWQKLATTDLDQIACWNEEHPLANWAVLADEITIFEADGIPPVDGKPGTSPRACIPDQLYKTAAFIIKSGGGSLHVAHANPPSGPKPKNWARVMPGADTRGIGGGSILPGSVSYKGAYTWEREPGPQPFTPFPDKLAHQLKRNQDRNREHIRKTVKGDGPIPQGMRDTAMFQTIADLWNGGMDPDELLQVALEINRARCTPSLPEATIRKMVARRTNEPRRTYHHANADDLQHYQEPGFLSEAVRFTTSGYARRLAINYPDRVTYAAQWGWLYYKDGRWHEDTGQLHVSRLVKDTIALASAWSALPEQEDRWGDKEMRELWFRSTKSAANKVPAIVQSAASEPELASHAEEFDANLWLINTPEGVLDLRHPRDKPTPHTPELRCRKMTGAHFNPTAKCPMFEAALRETLCGDAELMHYMQMLWGYMLTGDTSEQLWFLFVGRTGRNGKGTLIEVMRHVLGDYMVPLDIHVLLASRKEDDGQGPKPALCALVNARIATSEEPDGGLGKDAVWNMGEIKNLTGQDGKQIRDLYGKTFNWMPTVKLIVSVNTVPVAADQSKAAWDRMITIPFRRYFSPENRDNDLREKLKTEASGILNWLLDGLEMYLKLKRDGKSLSHPDVVPKACKDEKLTEQERDDPYAPFFNGVLVYDERENARVTLQAAWDAWKAWRAEVEKVDKLTAPPACADPRAFAKLAESRGHPKRRGHNNTTVLCYSRLATAPAPPASDGHDDGQHVEGGCGGASKSKTEKTSKEGPSRRDFTGIDLERPPCPPPCPLQSTVIANSREFAALVDTLLAHADVPVCLDIETNGLCPETNQIVAIQLHQEGGPTAVVDWRYSDTTWRDDLLRLLRGVQIVGHNLNFDISMLIAQEKFTRRDVTVAHDTMLVEQVIYGASKITCSETGEYITRSYSLAAVAERYGITIDKAEQKGWQVYTRGSAAWNEPFTPEQVEYAARDVAILPTIMKVQREQLEDSDQQAVADLEHRILPVVADTRAHGPYVDRERWAALAAEDAPHVAAAAEKVKALLGKPEINLNSPAQLLPALADVGVSVENTREETLTKLRSEYPVVEALLEYRALAKAQSTYGTDWLEKYVSPSGRVHASWQQIGAESGRMICSQPNIQQIPKDAHREAIIAPEGYTLLIADLSNAELRIAAACSGDETMIRAFREGRDLHSDAARLLFGLGPDDDVRAKDSFAPGKSYRDAAKTANFSLIYGVTPSGLTQRLGLDPKVEENVQRAREVIQQHQKAYPRLWSWLKTNQNLAVERSYAVTVLGRRRYFDVPAKPNHWIEDKTEFWQKYGKPLAEMKRQASNHPVQGGCADIFKMVIALLNEAVDAKAMHVAAYIHDELVLEVPNAYLDEVETALKRAVVLAGEWAEVPFPEPEVVRSHHWCNA